MAGWAGTGANCERYNMVHDGFCTSTATCDTSVLRCATAPNVARAVAASCPSPQCRDLTKCVPNTDVTLSDSQDEVCLISKTSAACTGYTCTNKLSGLNGGQCLKYSINGVGFCNAGGVCETTCQAAFNQATSVHQECASPQCLRPGRRLLARLGAALDRIQVP